MNKPSASGVSAQFSETPFAARESAIRNPQFTSPQLIKSIASGATLSDILPASTETIGSPRLLIPMKTSVGKISFVAASLCLTPAVCPAQNIASVPGTVNRSLERLTLLPGPYLLSPARTTPTMMPSPMKLDAVPAVRFEPAVPRFLSGGRGSLRLIDRTSFNVLSLSGRPAEPLPSLTPTPETFHFKSNLKSPPVRMRIELRPPTSNPQ